MAKFRPIELSVDELCDVVTYFKETGSFVWARTRKGASAGSQAGSIHAKGYITIRIHDRLYLAHRLAWYIETGEQPEQIDHINGVKDDNRICNLRAATPNQNQHNKALNKNNTSGVKGVSWNESKKKWEARVWMDGKCNRLGRFSDLAMADAAVRQFRKDKHKDFCNHGDIKK